MHSLANPEIRSALGLEETRLVIETEHEAILAVVVGEYRRGAGRRRHGGHGQRAEDDLAGPADHEPPPWWLGAAAPAGMSGSAVRSVQ